MQQSIPKTVIVSPFLIFVAVIMLAAFTGKGPVDESGFAKTPRIQFIGVVFSQSESGKKCQYSISGAESETFTLAKGGLLLIRPFSSASASNWKLNVQIQKNTSGEDPVVGNASRRSGVRPNGLEMFSIKPSLQKKSHHIKIDCVSSDGTVVPAVYSPGFEMAADTTGVVEDGLPPAPGAAAATGGPTMVIDD